MPDILAIGESLIDFLASERGVRIENTTAFSLAPGGAPANVAAAAAKLGASSGFIGKVGADSFGAMIRKALSGVGVNVDMLLADDKVNTTLAFISVKPGGEPDFVFYRNRCGADLALRKDEIDDGYVRSARILHYGSISFTGEPLKGATLKTIETAKEAGALLSYDPNLRPSLWDDLARARSEIEMGMRHAGLVKLTEEELEFVTGVPRGTRLLKGCGKILEYGPRFVVVTRGKEPCFAFDGSSAVEVPAFRVEQVDSTGGGDAFVGGMLLTLLGRLKRGEKPFRMEREEIRDMLRFAHACGAITVTRKGVIPALPTMEEASNFLKSH
jgi:sugar/nucleoside kinase (ribokinase family)